MKSLDEIHDMIASIKPPVRCPYCDHFGNVREGRCQQVGTIVVRGGEAVTVCGCECPTPAQPDGGTQ